MILSRSAATAADCAGKGAHAAAAVGVLVVVAVPAFLLVADAPAALASASAAGRPLAQIAQDDVKYYIVPKPVDGKQEFLFEIAEKTLGDGNRFPEIVELNRGRLQPGGQRLDNPDNIVPGWILRLPDDAAGPGVKSGPLPTIQPLPGRDAADGVLAGSDGAQRQSAAPAPAPAPVASASPAGPSNSKLLLIGGSVLALVLGAVGVLFGLFDHRSRGSQGAQGPRPPKPPKNRGRRRPDGPDFDGPDGPDGPHRPHGERELAAIAAVQSAPASVQSYWTPHSPVVARPILPSSPPAAAIPMIAMNATPTQPGPALTMPAMPGVPEIPGVPETQGVPETPAPFEAAAPPPAVADGRSAPEMIDSAIAPANPPAQTAAYPTAPATHSVVPPAPPPPITPRVPPTAPPRPEAPTVQGFQLTVPPMTMQASFPSPDTSARGAAPPASAELTLPATGGHLPTAARPQGISTRPAGNRRPPPQPAPPMAIFERVSFGDDVIQAQIAIASPGSVPVEWTPMPYDVPQDGVAYVCLGVGEKGCLFVDLGRAPGPVSVGGDSEAAARLVESIAFQLSAALQSVNTSVTVVGDIGKTMELGQVTRASTLGQVVARGTTPTQNGQPQLELVLCSQDTARDATALAWLTSDRTRKIVPIVVGSLPNAPWSFIARAADHSHEPITHHHGVADLP